MRSLRRLPPLLESETTSLSLLNCGALTDTIAPRTLVATLEDAADALRARRTGALSALAAFALVEASRTAPVDLGDFQSDVAAAATRLQDAGCGLPRVQRAVDAVRGAIQATFDTSLAESSSSLCYAHPIGFVLAARQAALATARSVVADDVRDCAAIAAAAGALVPARRGVRIAVWDDSAWFASPQWSAAWGAVLDAERRGLEPTAIVDSDVAAWALRCCGLPEQRIARSGVGADGAACVADVVFVAADCVAADGTAGAACGARREGSGEGSDPRCGLARAAALAKRSAAPLYVLAPSSAIDCALEFGRTAGAEVVAGLADTVAAQCVESIVTERCVIAPTRRAVAAAEAGETSHAFVVRALS
jgi:methylthioribose-1-phosphate isomerase